MIRAFAKMFVVLVVWVAGVAGAAELTLTVDRADAVYACGEEATVRVTTHDAQGGTLSAGQVAFTVDAFGTNRLFSRTLDMAKENPYVWRGTLKEPGFLRCAATPVGAKGGKPVVVGIAFDPQGIRLGSGGAPEDFDAYWQSEIARLDRAVPLEPRISSVGVSHGAESFLVSFATFNGKRVYGFLTVPTDHTKAPFPVRFSVPWAGPGVHAPEAWPDDAEAVTLVMNVHDFEPGPDAVAQRRKYDEQSRRYADEVKGVSLKSSYENHRYAGYADRSSYFYHDALLGIRRAFLWVLARPDVDRMRVGYFGRSQGGGLGIILAALTPEIKRALFCQPAMADMQAYRQGRRSGWPMLVERATLENRAAVERTAAYYDAGHFAARLACESRVIIGFADDTCPPPCVYAAYNAIRAPKSIVHDVGVPHSDPSSYRQNQAWVLGVPARAAEKADQ